MVHSNCERLSCCEVAALLYAFMHTMYVKVPDVYQSIVNTSMSYKDALLLGKYVFRYILMYCMHDSHSSTASNCGCYSMYDTPLGNT